MRRAISFTLAALALPFLLVSSALLWAAERARGPIKTGSD